jgi:hypothetical protein
VQLLLRKGAAVNAKSHEGETSLMMAQRMRTVTVLLNAHADANAVDVNGHTVLHYCARQGAAECVYKLLLQHGAVPTAVDRDGSTAAHIAGMSGHFADETFLSTAADEYKTHAAASSETQLSLLSSSMQQQCHITSAVTSSSSSSSSSSGQKPSDSADIAVHGSSSGEAAAAASSEAIDGSAKQKKQKVKQPCANCKKLTTKRCRRCAAVYYCRTECQKVCFKDAEHRAQCEEIASATV